MKLLSSVVGGIGLTLVASTLALGGCGGDKSAVGGTGGAADTGGAGNAGGGGGDVGGGSTGGAGGAGSTCAPKKVPESGMMTDFSEQTEGATADLTSKDVKWGTSTSLTGGTFIYQQEDADAPTGKVESGELHITATIAATHYNGFGFYFGPNCGSDATAFAGFQFDIGGTITGAAIDVQMQMTPDYPLNQDNKGACDYAASGQDMWSYCTNPHVSFSKITADAPFPETMTTVKVPWSELVGGNPVSAVDATQLLGIQLQFNCGDTDCPIDVKVDNLKFYL